MPGIFLGFPLPASALETRPHHAHASRFRTVLSCRAPRTVRDAGVRSGFHDILLTPAADDRRCSGGIALK